MKRAFDICLGCLAVLILFVPVLLVAVAVRLTSKGPALYWSDRVGRNNVIFKMPKFRSMRVGQFDIGALIHRIIFDRRCCRGLVLRLKIA